MLHCNCLMKLMIVNQLEDEFVILWSVYNSDENDELKAKFNWTIWTLFRCLWRYQRKIMQRNEWYLQCIMIILFKFPVSSYSNSSNFDVMVHLFWNSFKNTEVIPTYFKHLHMMHFVICNLNLIIQRFGLTDSAYFLTNIWT